MLITQSQGWRLDLGGGSPTTCKQVSSKGAHEKLRNGQRKLVFAERIACVPRPELFSDPGISHSSFPANDSREHKYHRPQPRDTNPPSPRGNHDSPSFPVLLTFKGLCSM